MTHRWLNWTHWSFCQVPEIRKIRIKWTSIRRWYDWSKLLSSNRKYSCLEKDETPKFRSIDNKIFSHGNSGPQKILWNNGCWNFYDFWLVYFSQWEAIEIPRPKKDEAITGTGQKWLFSAQKGPFVGLNFLAWEILISHFFFSLATLAVTPTRSNEVK